VPTAVGYSGIREAKRPLWIEPVQADLRGTSEPLCVSLPAGQEQLGVVDDIARTARCDRGWMGHKPVDQSMPLGVVESGLDRLTVEEVGKVETNTTRFDLPRHDSAIDTPRHRVGTHELGRSGFGEGVHYPERPNEIATPAQALETATENIDEVLRSTKRLRGHPASRFVDLDAPTFDGGTQQFDDQQRAARGVCPHVRRQIRMHVAAKARLYELLTLAAIEAIEALPYRTTSQHGLREVIRKRPRRAGREDQRQVVT